MSEWIKFTGSDEQIDQMENASNGYVLRLMPTKLAPGINQTQILYRDEWVRFVDRIQQYFLCNPHPRADMICQQARTGQQVYCRINKEYGSATSVGTTPNWNIQNAEYSFTPFDEE